MTFKLKSWPLCQIGIKAWHTSLGPGAATRHRVDVDLWAAVWCPSLCSNVQTAQMYYCVITLNQTLESLLVRLTETEGAIWSAPDGSLVKKKKKKKNVNQAITGKSRKKTHSCSEVHAWQAVCEYRFNEEIFMCIRNTVFFKPSFSKCVFFFFFCIDATTQFCVRWKIFVWRR